MLLDASKSSLLIVDVQERLLPAMVEPERIVSRNQILLKAAEALESPVTISEQYPKGVGRTVSELLVPTAKVFEKMIKTYKNAGRISDAKATIERARVLLGKNDLFSDKQIISLLRETRQNQEALVAIRSARQRAREDYSLLRLEASILTDLGKVDEGVALFPVHAAVQSEVPRNAFRDCKIN